MLEKKNSRIFIFLGDASVESGVFYESINFASIKNLNITFICENNKYSVYSNLTDRQLKNRKIYEVVSSFGIKSKKKILIILLKFIFKKLKILSINKFIFY